MSTHNIGFYEEEAKLSLNYYQISSNTHLISSAEIPKLLQNTHCNYATAYTEKIRCTLSRCYHRGTRIISRLSSLTEEEIICRYLMIIERLFLTNLHKNQCFGCSLELTRRQLGYRSASFLNPGQTKIYSL